MEQQTVSLKLCITELTHRQVGKNGDDFVYVNDKTRVPQEVLINANLLKAKKEEDLRVSSINAYTQSYITKKYPLEKQSSANLGIYGEEHKTEMISFISNCITLSNEAIENNTSFEDYKAMLNEWRY